MWPTICTTTETPETAQAGDRLRDISHSVLIRLEDFLSHYSNVRPESPCFLLIPSIICCQCSMHKLLFLYFWLECVNRRHNSQGTPRKEVLGYDHSRKKCRQICCVERMANNFKRPVSQQMLWKIIRQNPGQWLWMYSPGSKMKHDERYYQQYSSAYRAICGNFCCSGDAIHRIECR